MTQKKDQQPDKEQTDNIAANEKAAAKGEAQKPVVKAEVKIEEPPASGKQQRKPKTAGNKAVTEKTKSVPSFTAALALVLAITAFGLGVYDLLLGRKQATLISGLHESQAVQAQHSDLLAKELQTVQIALQNETQLRQAAEAEHQTLRAALDSISERLGRTTVAWRLAEVEYLLTVANQRLTLAQDVQTAIAIFDTADQRLKAIADPALLPVRKAIAKELTALRALPQVDIAGLSLRLGALADQVQQLPLLDQKRLALANQVPSSHKVTSWQELPAAVWQDLKTLVQVRRHEQPIEPLLPPQQSWFLYQNLQLKLQQARLAIMQHDTVLLHKLLQEAISWMENFFERDNPAVQSAMETMTQLAQVELAPTLPDVSGSLRTLRQLLVQRQDVAGETPAAGQKAVAKKAAQP